VLRSIRGAHQDSYAGSLTESAAPRH